jgi:hypothetical protein
MSGPRQSVKTAIQNVVKNAVGVKKVSTYRPKLMVQTDLPLVVISLSKSKETRLSASAPHGKKVIEYTAQLEISQVDVSNDGSGQLAFDDLLDAIDTQLRTDPTFGGVAIGATVNYINTMLTPPQVVGGQNIILLAIKQFDFSVLVNNG